MTGLRRHGRERALQLLTGFEGAGAGLDALRRVAADYWSGQPGSPALREFANTLFFGAAGKTDEIDPVLAPQLQHWKIERLTPVDRNLLRLGIYELGWCPQVPPKVVINEYIELAKKFGEGGSPALVNGVLDALHKSGLRARVGGAA